MESRTNTKSKRNLKIKIKGVNKLWVNKFFTEKKVEKNYLVV